jgi:hypothetical protein
MKKCLHNLSALCPPVPDGTLGQVGASFRLRNLRETRIHPSESLKRRLKPTATIIENHIAQFRIY